MKTKICCKCKQEKQLKDFYFSKRMDKYLYSCKDCCKKLHKQQYNAIKDDEDKLKAFRDKQNEFWQKNPEKKYEYFNKWRRKNMAKINKARREKNIEKKKEKSPKI